MLQNKYSLPFVVLATIGMLGSRCLAAEEMSARDAWKALPKYEYGQDMASLLAIDREVIRAMASPETRSACATRLAALLASSETTLPARHFICLQLRQVGTSAEVPLLAKLLVKPTTLETARQALEAIPGTESLSALRAGLTRLQGAPLVGLIHSVAVRKDVLAVPTLQRLAVSSDKQIAAAALWALGNIASDRAADFLAERAEQAGFPTPQNLAVPLLRCAAARVSVGNIGTAKTILQELSKTGQAAGVRRAALEGLLCLHGTPTTTVILQWLADPDADRCRIALGHLQSLPDGQLDKLLLQLPDLPDAAKLAVIELASSRRGKKIVPLLVSMAQSDNPQLQLAGVRGLGLVGDASATALLVNMLSAGGPLTEAAQDALVKLSGKEANAALLDALRNRPAVRKAVIAVLKKQKCYAAIDPLVSIASQPDPDLYGPALDGLKGIADPDKTDIARLVKLLLKTAPGRHRDEVEKTISIVCNKLPTDADRSTLVLAALARVDPSQTPKYLPLLGRLGGAKALERIRLSLRSTDPNVRKAAVRALCNWPNAEVADQLLDLATHVEQKAPRRWALRAYIRVVTLPSDRPESQTLTMLQNAMKLAENIDDKQLALERAATIRTMETVTWIAQYLDDPQLGQTACKSIVELAHHRFLRHPNMARFGPLLENVGRISEDPAVVERAKRYRLGL
jgi:HEAT repeat protein